MLNKKRVSRTIQVFNQKLKKIPEITKALNWMKNNPYEFIDVCEEYLSLLKTLDNLSESDKLTIKKANKLMLARGVAKTSASHITTWDFVNVLSKKVNLHQMASKALEGSASDFTHAVNQLAEMMYNGHKMFASGGTPRDGDPKSDSVIWGHTQARKDVDAKVLVYLIIPHFLARFFSFSLAEFKILREKDDLFTPLTDAILLNKLKNPNKERQILNVWVTRREDGGLSWLREEQIAAYRDVMNTS